MFSEIIQELFYGPDPTIAALIPTGVYSDHFYLDKFCAGICLGVGWGIFLKSCTKKTKWLKDENPNYVYLRNRNINLNDTLKSMLSSIENDINHLSPDFFKYGFMPYQFVSRDDYRLGEAEWRYENPQPPSQITASGHMDDIPEASGPNGVEFEYFKKAMKMCGRFKLTELRQMFRHAIIIDYEPNEMICEIGDPDIYMVVVVSGQIEVMVVDEQNMASTLRVAERGDRIMSLFSLIDILTGNSKPYKSVEIFSKNHSRVIKFAVTVFKDYLHLHPEKIPDVIRRIVRKIYEINFLMLHRILGLALDVVNQGERIPNFQAEQDLMTDTYPIPDPSDEISEQIRTDAIKSLMEFLKVPEESAHLFSECPVFILDPDEDDIEPQQEVEFDRTSFKQCIVDDQRYKFKYIFKGKVELYRLESDLNEVDRLENLDDNFIRHETVCILYPGEGMGGLATFAEADNMVHVRVKMRTIIVTLTELILVQILKVHPQAVYPIANQILIRLSPIIRRMDFGFEWGVAHGGNALFITGNEVKDTYVVLSGRLRSYMIDPKGKLSFYGEYEKGDWIGLVEALVKFPIRSKTVIAIRDTEVCKIPMDFITFLKQNFPSAAFSLLNYMVSRVGKYRFHARSLELKPEEQLIAGTSRRCASLALIPTSENIPYIPFAKEIKKHHDVFGRTAMISWATIQDVFRIDSLDYALEYTIETWVMSVLERCDLVVFVCCKESLLWTEMCIRHAETLVVLGTQGNPIGVTQMERLMLETTNAKKRKELVILHPLERDVRPSRYALPKDTIAWLEVRPWLHVHHHIRIPGEAFDYKGLVSESEIDMNYEPLKRTVSKHSDMAKYCRWLMGKSIGVVFTSGGARMAVQLGIFRAMIEHDIPIDMVGGVGNGLIIAALYSIYEDIDRVTEICEEFFTSIDESYKTPFDYTFPYISPVQGRALIAIVEKIFARTRMEDTWIPFFALTCDISKQDARVHRDGPFWIYIRASLSNFVQAPPICDPKDGGYIVDGSFVNPIPEDIMRDFGAEYVLVINTSVGKMFEPPNLDMRKDIFTNLWRLFIQLMSRLNFSTPDAARINEMIGRTQKVMYSEAVEANTEGLFVAFIRPDMENVSSQIYKDFKRLCYIGYKYAGMILRTCPVKGVPFHEFWLNLRNTSSRVEVAEGRGFTSNINDEFWDKMEGRIFERDDKIQELQHAEAEAKLRVEKNVGTISVNGIDEIELPQDELKLQRFREWLVTKGYQSCLEEGLVESETEAAEEIEETTVAKESKFTVGAKLTQEQLINAEAHFF